jgi:hypothetical protein
MSNFLGELFLGILEVAVTPNWSKEPTFDTVYVQAKKKFGSFSKAADWMDRIHPQLNGKTPRQAIQDGQAEQALASIKTCSG